MFWKKKEQQEPVKSKLPEGWKHGDLLKHKVDGRLFVLLYECWDPNLVGVRGVSRSRLTPYDTLTLYIYELEKA